MPRKEEYIHEDREIKFSVIRKLPRNAHILALVKTKDMGGTEREAMLVMFRDEKVKDLRQAYFAIANGEYLGDKIPYGNSFI